MAMRRGPPMAVGSSAWIAEERNTALDMARSEIDEFSFAARNEMEWLNEHMAEIFSENQMNVVELFKTPGKLRGKTPRTARKANAAEVRVPLSDVFSSTPKGAANPFMMSLEQARTPKIRVAEDRSEPSVSRPTSPAKANLTSTKPVAPAVPKPTSFADSGYHGSQTQETVDIDMLDQDVDMLIEQNSQRGVDITDFATQPRPLPELPSPTTASAAEETFESAREEPTRTAYVTAKVAAQPSPPAPGPLSSPVLARAPSPALSHRSPRSPSPRKNASPTRTSPIKSSPLKQVQTGQPKGFPQPVKELDDAINVHEDDDIRSPSDGSSPIRPVIRSSLNFASLPAREPRQSYYNRHPGDRHTGGKSLGGGVRQELADEDEDDEMDVDEPEAAKEEVTMKVNAHSKSYTQRLQDRISMLGAQSAAPRPSKSIATLLPSQQPAPIQPQPPKSQPAPEPRPASPEPKKSLAAPGAFPEDDDDDWIAPPATVTKPTEPRPAIPPKSHSSDLVQQHTQREAVRSPEVARPKSRPGSPNKAPAVPERSTSTPGHKKSASVPHLPTMQPSIDDLGLKKTVSVSNPTLATVSEDGASITPSKASRGFRTSPLKQVKDKLSRILTNSKVLLVSSAAVSAEGKASILSPSTTRLGVHPGPSVESFRTAENVLYPDLSHHAGPASRPASPVRKRATRASTEREKKEAKEAKLLAEQMAKLDKAREKEAEKARVFSKEQEQLAAMEKRVAEERRMAEEKRAAEERRQAEEKRLVEESRLAEEKRMAEERRIAEEKRKVELREQERAARYQAQQQELKTPAPGPKKSAPVPSSPPKATRTSPRKTKGQAEAESRAVNNLSSEDDVEMAEPTTTMPPPSVPRSVMASASRPQGIKRPVKPTKEPLVKTKLAPTVIRVNTTSSQQSQLHTSNNALSANLGETLSQPSAPARQLTHKSSQPTLQSKQSLASLKSSVSSTGPGRPPKSISMAAKRKEQEEREAQRKREAKLQTERKRAADEERRQEEARRLEAERRKEEERQAKKAALEKAKRTPAPPPAARMQEYNRPASRLAQPIQQDNRPATGKAASKRPLQQDNTDELSRPQPQRNMASYHQSKEAKRMRMSEEFDEDFDMADSQPSVKNPPIRPSAGLKKDPKSMFSSGYANASQSGNSNLLKAAVAGQHNSQLKAGNPLDMAQVSKGNIVFAPNPNASGQPHKTPARAAPVNKHLKSAAKSSPRFPNGENIELPDINTDDEDSEDDDSNIAIAPWADSPALKAALAAQELLDPMQIFGPPRPINMEEVFNKSKDRFHKFRARTSSANWSGADRLTDEDVRKDLQAREKMRKEGGWSYELSREVA